MKSACIIHDMVNIAVLPVLCLTSILGIADVISCQIFLKLLLSYVIIDTIWIALQPSALPSCTTAILARPVPSCGVHHVVTFLLCLAPVFRPELAIFAALDGLTEINTFFLILRRQWKSQRPLLTGCYWVTFIPIRLVLFPYLLIVYPPVFLTLGVPPLELAGIMCMQALLCVFNVFVTWRSFAGWLRNRKAAAAAAAAGKSATQHCDTALGSGAHGAAGTERGVPSMQPPIAHVSVAGVLQQWSVPHQGIAAEKATAQQAFGRRQGSAARQLL